MSLPNDFWDQRYSEDGFAYGDAPNDFLREVVDRIPDGDVVCLAEGEGRNAVFVASLPRSGRVIAVDRSGVGLAKAERLAAARGVAIETVVADLATYEPPRGLAGVVSIWTHLPPEVRRAVHARVVAALRPGGALVLEAYTPRQIGKGTGGPQEPAMMMTLAGLREELRGLTLVIGRELDREIHEGRYHQGPSSVVQVYAIKPT